MIYLDTHVVLWIGTGLQRKLSQRARAALAEGELRVSPIVVLELELLHEFGKIRPPAGEIVATLKADLGLTVCELPFPEIVRASLPLHWTRDPFDRLIAGHALAAGRKLVTADAVLNEHLRCAVW